MGKVMWKQSVENQGSIFINVNNNNKMLHILSCTSAQMGCCYSGFLEPAEGLLLLQAEHSLGFSFDRWRENPTWVYLTLETFFIACWIETDVLQYKSIQIFKGYKTMNSP